MASIRHLTIPTVAIIAAVAGACTDRMPPKQAAPAGVVDSALPVAELLRRFRAALPDTIPVQRFEHAAASRDALIRQFVAALNARDSARFRELMLDRREFAWLYYDDHFLSKPPYEMPPWLMWQRAVTLSDNGLGTALAEYGGRSLTLEAVTCPDSTPKASGALLLWDRCVIRMRTPAKERIENQFFGTIVGRDGRWKFVSYASDL